MGVKTLVHNDAELIALFDDYGVEEIENEFDIVFAFIDGKFPDDPEVNDTLDVDRKVFRKKSDDYFPLQYPCIVVTFWEKTYDRLGRLEFRFTKYVYENDWHDICIDSIDCK
jgi:hypothetical protein